MKKTLLITCCSILLSIGAYAQTVSYGVNAGLNLTKLPAFSDGASVSNGYLAGFHVGGLVDIKFDSFSIQPGILFTTKGGKSDLNINDLVGDETISGSGTVKTTLDYIEVPVNFIYRVPAGDGNVFFGAGPYIALGISGKATADVTANGQSAHQSQDVTFGSGDGDVKNPDYGFNVLAGYELNSGFTIGAGYGQSFASTSNTSGRVKNEGFNFSLGYFFK